MAVDAVAGQSHGIVQHKSQHAAVHNSHGIGSPGLGIVLQLHGKGGTVAGDEAGTQVQIGLFRITVGVQGVQSLLDGLRKFGCGDVKSHERRSFFYKNRVQI